MKDKTPLVGLVILLSFCSGLRVERKKEEEVVKDVRGFSRESRKRGKKDKKERKMPRSSVLGVADDTGRSAPARDTPI